MRIRIKMNAPNSFLEEPIIKNKEKALFDLMNDEIEGIITSFWEYIEMSEEYINVDENILSIKERIKEKFKEKFWEKVIKNAIQLSFDGKGGFNLLANVLERLSEENLREILNGEILIGIFDHELKSLPVKSSFDTQRRSNKINWLTQKYIYNDD